MLLGLFNALASFHGYINMILAEKLDIIIIVCLIDILYILITLAMPILMPYARS